MLQGNKPRILALPPQSPQLVVNGVARARTRARTVQTNHCGDCGGNQVSCGFPALSLLEAGRTPAIDPLRLQQHAILALDLGQKTGWAVRNADGAIASGTVEFKPGRFEGGGMVYLRFRAWLQEVDETAGGIGAVYFEEVRFHAGVTAAHAYGGYLAHLTAWAEMNKIPYRGVPVATIKRHVTGRGNADKDAVIVAVRALGFNPTDDNEADALALLDWALNVGGRQ